MTRKRVDTPSPPQGTEHLAVLTMDEVAGLLRCTRQHVYTLHQREGLPITRLGERFVGIRVSDLDTWLSKQRQVS
jgi:excisionase family DNA binding protein